MPICAISWRMRGKSSSGCSSQSSSALTGFPGLGPVRPLCRVSIVSCQQKCSCRRSQPGSWPRHTASNNTLRSLPFELLVLLQKSDAEVSCSNKSRVLLPAAAISKLILTLGRPGPWSRTSTSTAQEATLHTEVLLRARRRVRSWCSPHLNSRLGHQPQPVNISLTQKVEVSREVCELIFSLLKHAGKKQYYLY